MDFRIADTITVNLTCVTGEVVSERQGFNTEAWATLNAGVSHPFEKAEIG